MCLVMLPSASLHIDDAFLKARCCVEVPRRTFLHGLTACLAMPTRLAAETNTNVIDAGAHGVKANGHDADDDALDRAIAAAIDAVRNRQQSLTTNQYFRGGIRLCLPAGPIRLLRGHVIRSGHVTVEGGGSGTTILVKAGGDFGDLLEIRDPLEPNNTGGGGFSGLGAIDIGPTSGGALLRLTGCHRGSTHDIATHNGFFGLQLDGVSDYAIAIARCTGDRYFGQTPAQAIHGEQGSAKSGSAFIALTHHAGGLENSNVQMSDITATGEGPAARLHHAAIRVESADVLLLRSAELGAVMDADLLIEVGAARSVQNLQTSEVEFDNGADYGLKLSGTTQGSVGDWIIQGRFFGHDRSHVQLDCAKLAGATFEMDGLGAARSPVVVAKGSDITFIAPMLRGFASAAAASHELSGIDVSTSGVSILGGSIKAFAHYDLAYAVRLGDGLNGCMVVNTVCSPGPGAYAGVRCRDLQQNHVYGNLVMGGAPETARL